MVWNRSRVSTWSAFAPSPATPIISMKSMKPWVALPGACRLSRVTSAQAALEVAVGDPLHRLAVELRVGPVLAELARAAELERQVAGADDRDPLVARPRLDHLADGPAELRRTASAAAAAARRCWCRSARSAGRPAGRSVMIGQVMLWSIRSSLLKARSKSASRPSRRMCADRSSSPAQRSSAAGRTRAPRCTSWRRRTAPCRPGTAACCPATAGGSGRCRPSPARRARPGSASRGTPRSWRPTRRRTAAGPRRCAVLAR